MPQSETNYPFEFLTQKLIDKTQETQSLLEKIANNVSSNSIAIQTIKIEFSNVHTSVEQLSKILRDGNGQPSVITTLALLDTKIKNLEQYINSEIKHSSSISKKDLEELKKDLKDLDSIVKQKLQHDYNAILTDKAGRYSILAAAITSLIALVAALLAYFK